TNTYLVGRRDPILIDTGAGVVDYPALLARYLAERGWSQPSRIILTHRHADHLGGVSQLRARFRGLHAAERLPRDPPLPPRPADPLGGVSQLRARFRGIHVAKMLHRDPALPESIHDLRDGQKIEADGCTLIAIYTPGHASDHLCYYLVEEKALFTGDVVLAGSTTVIPAGDGDLLDYMNSLKRLQELAVRG